MSILDDVVDASWTWTHSTGLTFRLSAVMATLTIPVSDVPAPNFDRAGPSSSGLGVRRCDRLRVDASDNLLMADRVMLTGLLQEQDRSRRAQHKPENTELASSRGTAKQLECTSSFVA